MKSFRCHYLFWAPITNRASVLRQSKVRQAISPCLFFIANFGLEHSKEEERGINETYELITLTIWIKSFRIVRAFSCYVTSFQTDKTLGKRKGCVKRKQNFIGLERIHCARWDASPLQVPCSNSDSKSHKVKINTL